MNYMTNSNETKITQTAVYGKSHVLNTDHVQAVAGHVQQQGQAAAGAGAAICSGGRGTYQIQCLNVYKTDRDRTFSQKGQTDGFKYFKVYGFCKDG